MQNHFLCESQYRRHIEGKKKTISNSLAVNSDTRSGDRDESSGQTY